MELKLSQSSLIFNSSSFYPKHFTLFAQRCKHHIQRITWRGREMSKKILLHVVKEGETLSSISKLYGVPILEIAAANKEIVDVNLVFGGQHLNIPSAIQGSHFDENKLHENQLSRTTPRLGFHSRQWNQIFTVPSSHQLSIAKTTASFLVVVPLIAFCIRCIIGAFQNRIARNLRHKSGMHSQRSNSMRWKTVFNDLGDPDASDNVSEPNSDPLLDEEEKLHYEDISDDYTKLEDDYQKFLSECGMSKWGYWRGGSPK